ncbi:MAG: hypothetical protein IT288_07380 [Bdellovibrionales bacterium]|nr:hypothetical protein [Bdellovibrionales bacterium]
MIFAICILITFLGILATSAAKSAKASLTVLSVVTFLNLVAVGFGIIHYWDENQNLYFWSNYFVSDATSRTFLILINLVMVGFTPYAINRVRTNQLAAKQFDLFVRMVLIFFLLCLVVLFSNNVILMWAALEGTTLAVVPLIYHQRGQASFRASWKYLIYSTVGLSLTFLGFIFLAQAMQQQAGEGAVTFFFNEISQLNLQRSIWSELGILFVVLGLCSKLGLAPLYSWLPETYDHAPPSITGLLAGVQFNCTVLMLFRFVPVLSRVEGGLLQTLLIAIGLVSILVAGINIVITKNYKKLIAYASINHAGIIAIGLGAGKSAYYGVILYVLSNALVKAILFFTSGNIKARYGTKDMSRLQGLIKDMPYSGLSFMIGIFALLGFAPFGSFIGELMILSRLMEAGNWLVFIALGFLIVMIFVATGRSVFPMIWGQPQLEPHQRSESILSLAPNLFFLMCLLSLGIYIPTMGNRVLLEVARVLGGP